MPELRSPELDKPKPKPRRMWPLDILGAVGLGAIGVGVWGYDPRASLIVVGVVLLTAASHGARTR